MLLWNIDPSSGLCNGTRLISKSLESNIIDVKIVVSQHAGKRVYVPRSSLYPSESHMFPSKMKIKQIHVRLSFAMTLNKAQGQTIPHVGVYLPDSVFFHGQFYVQLSRGILRGNIKVTKGDGNDRVEIIMVNVFPPDHVDDLPEVEPNQTDLAPAIPKPALADENEEPKEEFEDKEEFEEEEPQEEEDMEVDVEEEENESELTFPYEEADPLNPPPPTSDSESDDVVEVKNVVEHEDETVSASVHEVGESSTATFLREDCDSLLHGFMRRDIDSFFGRIASLSRRLCGRKKAHALVEKKGKAKDKYYGKLILDLGNEVRSSVEEGAAAMENLVRKLGNAEEIGECKKFKKELEESRLSNTLLRMQKERVERDLFWTRVQAYEFYREMICRGVVFEERSNEAIDVPVKDKESPSSELRGSPRDF
ncbi:putative reverse transcriptase domain-containing protein [Tanacetum coccineum]